MTNGKTVSNPELPQDPARNQAKIVAKHSYRCAGEESVKQPE